MTRRVLCAALRMFWALTCLDVIWTPAPGLCGEARSGAGANALGGEGAPSHLSGREVSSDIAPRPPVPQREQLLGWRPAPENRSWLNDIALAGAVDAWSESR